MSSLAIDLHHVRGVSGLGGGAGVVRGGARRRGGHLRLVGDDERRPAASALRITRRGRLALTGTVALVLVLAFASLVSALGPAGASSSYVVQPGMTLSQIAAEQLPDRPLTQAISDLQQANKLSSGTIAVGQELVIPGR